jgi:hypothetical protein
MPESAVQLRVWLIGLNESEENKVNESEENKVKELINEYEFGISTTWEPAQGEIEYQSTGFADSEINLNQIHSLESALRDQFQEAEITFSGLDKSTQTTMDRPIKGAYHIRVER